MVRLLAGDRFKPGLLGEVLLVIADRKPIFQRSDLVRSEALIRLRVGEETVARKSSEDADRELAAAGDKLKFSLTFNPTDSFLWMMLYSHGTSSSGFDSKAVGYLEQSYTTGPCEGWIALRRNRLALAAFPTFSEVMKRRVVSEFAEIVDSDFIEAATSNLIGIGWEERTRLVASLSRANIIAREAFAKALAREGVTIAVPGVDVDRRFWQ